MTVLDTPVGPLDVDRASPEGFELAETQFDIALRRFRDEGCSLDPEAVVAVFNAAL